MKMKAQYSTAGLPNFYLGNPLIEALPPIRTREELEALLLNSPSINLSEIRALPAHARLHAIAELESFFVPRPELFSIESEISLLMRSGYMRRNPMHASTMKSLYTVREQMKQQGANHSPLPPCLIITALSGTGKTRSIRSILSLTPQVIHHRNYSGKRLGRTQITWISVDAPINGSPRGFLLRAFAAIDKALELSGPMSYVNQYGRAKISVDQKIEEFAQAASTFSLGLLHVDDLQRLLNGGRKQCGQVINMIIQLANVVKVPLVFSGTHQMVRALAGSLEAARRCSSGGIEDLPPADSHSDKHFQLMVQGLGTFQIMDEPIVFDEKIQKILFRLTLGIPAILIAVVTQAQKIALREGATSLCPSHFESAFNKHCALLQPALNALRGNDVNRYNTYEDLLPAKQQLEQEDTILFSTRRSKVSHP